MGILTDSLLMLLHLPVILGSEFFYLSNYCGDGHIAFSRSLGENIFYINGKTTDRVSFCKALQFYLANGCDFWKLGSDICYAEPSSVVLLLKAGRKLLQMESEVKPVFEGHSNVHRPASMRTPFIAAIGFFFVCCAFLFPCLYRKRKATSLTVLSKDSISLHSTSSVDMNSVSDKIPASPFRVPPSPLRVPPSPLRVPASPSRFSNSPGLSRLGSIHLNLHQVARATRNFSPACQIGEGGFGTMYRAQLEDGNVVAIKRAKKEQLENLQKEFSSEVELLAKIDHRNLVKLLGYIETGNERLIITEYVPNGTLREHLDGQRGRILDFNQRLEICIDVAHALTYLHLYTEKSIIHRDVKSSNILLTESMRAKVADFGFARLGPGESDQTHISTKVKGTVGYLDPEYMKTYQLTTKSDVYSFGILLLEIVTGRRPVELKKPVEERVTLRWAFKKYNDGSAVELLDPLMEEKVNPKIIMKMFQLAFQCAAPIRTDRPDMKAVGEQLWLIRSNYLKEPKIEN